MKFLLSITDTLNRLSVSSILVMLLLIGNHVSANTQAVNRVWDDLNALTQHEDTQVPRAMLFVSFSMPETSLKNYLQQAAVLDIPVYIRGLHQGTLINTQQKIAELIGNHLAGVAIDPKKFSQFNIKQVPSLIIAQSNTRFDHIAGHVSLDSLLKAIADKGEYGQNIAKSLLARMQTW